MNFKRYNPTVNFQKIATGRAGGNYVSVRPATYTMTIGGVNALNDPNQSVTIKASEDGWVKLFLTEGEELYAKDTSTTFYLVIEHNSEENPQSPSISAPISLSGTIQLNQN